MDFKISHLEYAYTSKGLVSISYANKEEDYFLDEKLTIPLVFCSGDKNVSYWRKKSNISEEDLKRVFGNSESIEHYNKKIEIANSLILEDKTLGLVYKANHSKVEYYIKEINKIVDVAFFDDNDNLLLCIEVFYTNKKTIEDIYKFNKLNIIVYEYDIQKRGSYPISAGTPQQEVNKRFSDGKRHIHTIKKRIERLKKGIERCLIKTSRDWRSYYEEEEIYRSKERELEQEIQAEHLRIYERYRERYKGLLNNVRGQEKNIKELTETEYNLRERIKFVRYEIAKHQYKINL